MATAQARIQLNAPIYANVDGQWRIVEAGTVLDVPSITFSAAQITVLSPGEAAGTLAPHGGPTPVRNFRSR